MDDHWIDHIQGGGELGGWLLKQEHKWGYLSGWSFSRLHKEGDLRGWLLKWGAQIGEINDGMNVE